MKKTIAVALLLAVAANIHTSIARRTLIPRTQSMEFIEAGTAAINIADTACCMAEPALPPFDENAVSLRGFNKRVSDNYETFFVRNNLQLHISGITLTLRYSDIDGNTLHERTLRVPCDLQPGKSRQVSINSFDRQHLFYYYLSSKPRNSATPFKVSARLMGYDLCDSVVSCTPSVDIPAL